MLKIHNPYNNELIQELPLADTDELENALKHAHRLFLDRSQWLAPHQRIAILEKAAAIMDTKVEELTRTAAQEGGKPFQDSKVEVLRAINGVKLAAQEVSQLRGSQIPMGLTEASVNRMAFTVREPIGVVASISAFNHPLNLIVHQTATAVAAGCPVIVKPASTTPLSCLAFVDILKEAGLPDGWCQSLICSSHIAEQLATDPRVNYLSFIGSAKVGWALKSKLSSGTRCALEHGGVAPVIVEKDADLEQAIPALVKGGFYHAGQVCVSVQKIYVHKAIAEDFCRLFSQLAANLIVGDPLDENTEVGPLILPKEVDRVDEWVQEAVQAGAKVLCGGKRISDTCYEPTVLYQVPSHVRVSREEVFGPVVCIYSYQDRNQAIKEANALNVHFQAAIFTKDLDIALDSMQKLNATAVMLNDHTAFRVDWMPFGGRDESGIGMGGIPYTIHEMTREKLMVFKSKVL